MTCTRFRPPISAYPKIYNWNSIFNCITDDLVFTLVPRIHPYLPVGGKLIQVRHQPVSSVADLHHCYLSDRRIWLRIRDTASSKRRLSNSSIRTMTMYQRWLREIPPAISIWPKQYWPGICLMHSLLVLQQELVA